MTHAREIINTSNERLRATGRLVGVAYTILCIREHVSFDQCGVVFCV